MFTNDSIRFIFLVSNLPVVVL